MLAWDRLLLAVVTLHALIPAAGKAQGAALEISVVIEGTKQGVFANESVRSSRTNRVVGMNFNYMVKIPRDAATGTVSGRRQHGPVILTRQWGAATPQLFQALFTNEVLKSVVFEFYQTNQSTGEEELASTVKLTNATVVEIHQYGTGGGLAPEGKHTGGMDTPRLEDVSFTFASIEIQNIPGKTMAADQLGLQR